MQVEKSCKRITINQIFLTKKKKRIQLLNIEQNTNEIKNTPIVIQCIFNPVITELRNNIVTTNATKWPLLGLVSRYVH